MSCGTMFRLPRVCCFRPSWGEALQQFAGARADRKEGQQQRGEQQQGAADPGQHRAGLGLVARRQAERMASARPLGCLGESRVSQMSPKKAISR